MMNILIVEDEPLAGVYLETVLKNLGYNPKAIAGTAKEAFEKLDEHSVDLVLMDINLAGNMDGLEAASEMRTRFNLPIIFITAYSDTKIRQKAMQLKPVDYLVKPLETSELKKALLKLAS